MHCDFLSLSWLQAFITLKKMTFKQSLLHCLIYSQVYMVLLEPISYRFMSPACLSTKERGFFPPYSFPSFPRETNPWIFQCLTSCKVISTNSLLQCFIVGKRQKLQNLITNDASVKKSWLILHLSLFYNTRMVLFGMFIEVTTSSVAFAC